LVVERRLFGLLFPLSLTQSHAWTAAGLVDEFNAGPFEGLPHNNQRCTSRFASRLLSTSTPPFRLLGLLRPLTLAEADTRATAVLVDEFDAGGL
jgi:hypothetical protein